MDGWTGVLLPIGAAASRGLRNIEKSEAFRVKGEVAVSPKRLDSLLDICDAFVGKPSHHIRNVENPLESDQPQPFYAPSAFILNL